MRNRPLERNGIAMNDFDDLYNITQYSWHYWRALINGKLDAYWPTSLQEAAFRGYLGTVRSCLEQGIDVDEEGLIGLSPLCTAIYGNQEEVASVLVENGACPKGHGIEKALRYAKAHGFSGIIRLVKEARK